MIREQALKVVLVLVGLFLFASVYRLPRWNQPELVGEQMLGGVYATLGVFLLLASRNSSTNRTLISFTAWSSVVHAVVMAVPALRNLLPHQDLPKAALPLVIIGLALIVLVPAKMSVRGTDHRSVDDRQVWAQNRLKLRDFDATSEMGPK